MVSEKTADVARRAKKLYEEKLRTKLEATNRNDFVAIEPDSGNYFLGKTYGEAVMSARENQSSHISFVIRIGHEAAVHIGVMTN